VKKLCQSQKSSKIARKLLENCYIFTNLNTLTKFFHFFKVLAKCLLIFLIRN
jgi:hypothetical protein